MKAPARLLPASCAPLGQRAWYIPVSTRPPTIANPFAIPPRRFVTIPTTTAPSACGATRSHPVARDGRGGQKCALACLFRGCRLARSRLRHDWNDCAHSPPSEKRCPQRSPLRVDHPLVHGGDGAKTHTRTRALPAAGRAQSGRTTAAACCGRRKMSASRMGTVTSACVRCTAYRGCALNATDVGATMACDKRREF